MSSSRFYLARLVPTFAALAVSCTAMGCAGGEAMASDTEAASVGDMDPSAPSDVTATTGVTGLTATTGTPSTTGTDPSGATTSSGPSDESSTSADASTGEATVSETEANAETGSDTDATSGEGSTSTDDPSSDTAETFVDLSGFVVHQTNTARSFTLPPATLVDIGGIVVVGRNASAGAFEQHWGIDLGDAIYFNAQDTFPAINGGETFRLEDPDGNVVDGPSITLDVGERLQRVDPTDGTPLGWESSTEATASPGTDATPGTLTFISEASDSSGSGAFAFEFVEIHVGG